MDDMSTSEEKSGETSEPRLTRRAMLAHLAALAASFRGATLLGQAGRLGTNAAKWDDRFELAVTFTIREQMYRRAHRPYVAVWMEDAQGRLVRTLCLWTSEGRGEGFIKELHRWYRDARIREAAGGPLLASTDSSATRLPGEYSVVWDGRDDGKRPVEQGQYFLCIEAAREQGTYQLIRQDYAFTDQPFQATLQGNPEIQGASVEYRRRK